RKASLLGLLVAVIVTLSVSRLGHRPGGAPGGAPRGPPGPRSPGNGALLVGAAVYGGIIAGIQSANQFGQDGGALWLNVAATSRPQDLRADLAGKNLASAVIAMPIFAVLYTCLGRLTGTPSPRRPRSAWQRAPSGSRSVLPAGRASCCPMPCRSAGRAPSAAAEPAAAAWRAC